MTYETLLTTLSENVLTITLNRPEKLNALTDVMLRELLDAFQRAETDASVRAILLTGAGRGFCAGQDLAAAVERGLTSGAELYGDHLRAEFNPLVLQMRRLPKPIIGAVNGAAAGAGMSFALACDLRLAAESASFIQAFVKIGLVPDSGSTWMLPRLIGTARALELMLTGRRLSANEALALGLVNRVLPDAELLPTAQALARELAAAPTLALGYTKQAVEFALNHDFEAALEYEAVLQDQAGKTSDHLEGVAAFLEKRPPRFTGS